MIVQVNEVERKNLNHYFDFNIIYPKLCRIPNFKKNIS